jgi:hypothetical protein
MSLPLHQSTIESYRSCPRKFLFAHRFGLVPKYRRRSRALDIGTFVHKLLAAHYSGSPTSVAVADCGKMIEQQAREVLEEPVVGVAPEDPTASMETDLALARTMVTVFAEVYPRSPRYRVLAVEKKVTLRQRNLSSYFEGTLDSIIHDTERDEVWIFDPKTCDDPPVLRAATCCFELQPRLYRLLASSLDLPAKLVGFCHPILQKPSISFCREDRPFEWYEWTLKRGARKGETEMRKRVLSDEPSFDLFLARVGRWYKGEIEFENLRAKRQAELGPPLLESWNRFEGPVLDAELMGILHEASRANRAKPRLHRFPRRSAACRVFNRTCPFLEPFCRCSRSLWKQNRADLFNIRQKGNADGSI